VSRWGLVEPKQGRVGPSTQSPARTMRPGVRRAPAVRRLCPSGRPPEVRRPQPRTPTASSVGDAHLTRVEPQRPRSARLAVLADAETATPRYRLSAVHKAGVLRLSVGLPPSHRHLGRGQRPIVTTVTVTTTGGFRGVLGSARSRSRTDPLRRPSPSSGTPGDGSGRRF